jgi:Alternative complex III, ActD subunit
MTVSGGQTIYGLMAEFDGPTSLVAAARRTQEAGYRRYDSFTPFPIHELFDAMDCHDKRVSLIVLVGGILGCAGGFGLASWVSAVAYPLNIGGRPYISWPMFIPVTFEVTILVAAISAFLSWIVLSGLPLPYHPVFNVKRFASHASQDGFFLAIEAADPQFDHVRTVEFLKDLGAREINEVQQ